MKLKYLFLLGGAYFGVCTSEVWALTCTATPSCDSMGYKQTASDCPSGGIKCPFDQTKMFCLKNVASYNFNLKTPVKLYDIVYDDGSVSATHNKTKKVAPIGVVYYLEPGMNGNKGLIVSVEQPYIMTWADAVKYCQNYNTRGTVAGDWRLPTMHDWFVVLPQYVNGTMVKSNIVREVNNKLKTLPETNVMGYSRHLDYGYNNSTYGNYLTSAMCNNFIYWNHISSSSYGLIDSQPSRENFVIDSSSYGRSSVCNSSLYGYGYAFSYNFWTSSELPTNTKQALVATFNTPHGLYPDNKTKLANFRCIMSFQEIRQ